MSRKEWNLTKQIVEVSQFHLITTSFSIGFLNEFPKVAGFAVFALIVGRVWEAVQWAGMGGVTVSRVVGHPTMLTYVA